jgi:outer membrane receptor protein involved in Fe transport
VLIAPAAFAQAPAGSPAQAAQRAQATEVGAGDSLLGEVVVTATRQVDTVSRVPLSITAVTQRALDQQGVTQLTDLSRVVPSLQITNTGAGGSVGQFAIRGVSSTAGAAVTGVYLDDVSLTKRNQNNIAGLNGSPAPPLFDLERVEVLRGPQGTLFGGSSMGGTVRFITPTPSLTTMSGYARAQVSKIDQGDWGYEGGVAVGGPIVQDKLGFRASAFHRKQAGWVDAVDPYTQDVFAKNNNWLKQDIIRGQLLWKPTEQLSLLGSIYASKEIQHDSNSVTLPIDAAADYLNDPVLGPQLQKFAALGWGGINDRCNVRPASPTARTSVNPVPCTPSTYRYPAHPAPAYDLGPDDSLRNGPGAYEPFRNEQKIYSLTADYDFGFANLRMIGAYLQDHQKSKSFDTSVITPMFIGYPFWLPELPTWNTANGGNFRPNNKRWGNTFEARLSSPSDSRPFSYVLGFFHQNTRATGHYNNIEDVNSPPSIIAGVTALQRYGAPLIQGEYATRYQNLKDVENSFFGEVNYWLWDQVKLTAGVRRAATSFTYKQVFWGTINGSYDPSTIPGGITSGTVKEKPISPRFSVQWQFTPDDQVYVTAAKGYRSGGVNSPLSEGQCGPALAELGLTTADVPNTFGSDTIWSYEGGTKLRLLNRRLAVNAAVYQLDWTGLQISVGPNRLGCGQQWIQNLGAARSRGAELEAQFRVFEGFTVSVNASYTSAKYTESALGPAPLTPGVQRLVFAPAGATLGQQPYRVNLQAQYNFKLMDKYDAYVRGDYTYTPQYAASEFGQTGYSPDSAYRSKTEVVNLRAGIAYNQVDLSLFVNNLTNSRDPLGAISGGRSGCSASTGDACTIFTQYTPLRNYTTFRPREIGVQANYRF